MNHIPPPQGQPEVRARAVPLTAPGQGGIAVLRLEGAEASAILSALFASPRGARPDRASTGQILYGALVQEGETLDEVLLCRLPGAAPAFEINCHGGALPAKRALEALQALGAQAATWEEVCAARAAEGGLDAVQAEAQALLPRALTRPAARMLLAQRRGALAAACREAAGGLPGEPGRAAEALERLIAAGRHGQRLVAPGRLVLAGRPNAGKSSLANALLRRDRVLVHERAGTTRDVVESLCELAGVPAVLADTAGLRDAEGDVERQGVELARAALRRADAAVAVLDGSCPLNGEDRALLQAARGRPHVVVANKCDLPPALDWGEAERLADAPLLPVSAKTGQGLDDLEKAAALQLAGPAPDLDGPVPFTQRQTELLRQAAEALSHRPPDAALAVRRLRSVVGNP